MVVITLIWIIALWANSLNFWKLSDRQKLDWFFYKIKTNIETVTNNALIWRAIDDGWTMKVPKLWRIDFNWDYNWNWTWTIKTYYSINWTIFTSFTENDANPENFYSIEINDWSNVLDTSWTNQTWWILIEWWNLSLTWAWIDSNSKVLEIKAKYKNFEKVFTINTISWVIEEK